MKRHSATALLVVDVQNGFLSEHTVDLPARIAGFISSHREAFELIVCSRFVNDPGSAYYRQVETSMTGGPSVELAPSLADLELPTVDASTYSSLSEQVRTMLDEAGIQHVVVCGVDTDQCVLMTALSALDAGYETSVLIDLCASAAGDDAHEAGCAVLTRALGDGRVLSSTELAGAMEPQAANS